MAAVNWRSWLHPRGKDGRFIHKFALVNIFKNPKDSVSNRRAVQRRARITRLTPEGAQLAYFENGKRVPGDPDNGFPEFIPAGEIGSKISSAPEHVARLDLAESVEILTDEVTHIDSTPEALRDKVWDDRALDDLVDRILALQPETEATRFVPSDADTARVAQEIVDRAVISEPQTTADVQDVATRYGAELVGLEHRIKGHDSLMRKLESDAAWTGETIQEAATRAHDALRYTMLFDPDTLKDAYENVLSGLREEGWTVNLVLDFFSRTTKEPYRGVNVRLIDPQGTRTEIQFHTPESFRLKMGANHKDYEVQRLPTTPKALSRALDIRMTRRSENLQFPTGYDRNYTNLDIPTEGEVMT